MKIVVVSRITRLLVRLCLEDDNCNLLVWLLQYHIIQADSWLAGEFYRQSGKYPQLLQTSMDMAYRLNQFLLVVEIYMSQGQVYQALKFVR